MGLSAGIWIALIPVALVEKSAWGAWKLAQPTQLRQELKAQLEAVLGATVPSAPTPSSCRASWNFFGAAEEI